VSYKEILVFGGQVHIYFNKQTAKVRARKFNKSLAVSPLGFPAVMTHRGVIVSVDSTTNKIVEMVYN
jgi:hypothetical protein